ncbi:Carboxylesterase, type B [Lasallia pustulata]|uniref:Carboxylic ester hydrolase n=1 Tax=Lasallia pustulata TaxID=136370 RepID=A0A1W5DCK6_9LECA|nr:Carboxylesterase, type B [Lasallia pustulata]
MCIADHVTGPVTLNLNGKGCLNGVAILDKPNGVIKCYRYGGVPYALSPIGEQRWKRPRRLPEGYSYGGVGKPGDFTGLSAVCPQKGQSAGNRGQVSEDCLQSNIWIPAGKPPEKGWPVWVYLHGGFLQVGSANKENPSNLFANTDVKCIIVMPAYRLNVFGFLASVELLQEAAEDEGTVGNLGFWDQRLALEWTFENINAFGGDASNITLGGMSAGAYAVIHQLAYELGLPDGRSLISRVVLWSNGPGVQPKKLPEVQKQFDELVATLDIPQELPAKDKLARLRALSSSQLVTAIGKMKQNSFRAITDGHFVRRSLFREIADGRFAEVMLKRGIKVMIGDLPDEANVYKKIKPPSSYQSLVDRLSVEYPRSTSKALARLYCPRKAPLVGGNWQDTFGRIYTDIQVYVTARGFISALAKTLPLENIYRYRINHRLQCVDGIYPREMGVTHASDITIWFYGNGAEVTASEQSLLKEYLKPFGEFLRGEQVPWGTQSIEETRTITSDQRIEITVDEDWERGRRVWDTLQSFIASKL